MKKHDKSILFIALFCHFRYFTVISTKKPPKHNIVFRGAYGLS